MAAQHGGTVQSTLSADVSRRYRQCNRLVVRPTSASLARDHRGTHTSRIVPLIHLIVATLTHSLTHSLTPDNDRSWAASEDSSRKSEDRCRVVAGSVPAPLDSPHQRICQSLLIISNRTRRTSNRVRLTRIAASEPATTPARSASPRAIHASWRQSLDTNLQPRLVEFSLSLLVWFASPNRLKLQHRTRTDRPASRPTASSSPRIRRIAHTDRTHR
jgi:hypothetical protein